MKKPLIIIIFILLIAGLAIGAYFLFIKKPKETVDETPPLKSSAAANSPDTAPPQESPAIKPSASFVDTVKIKELESKGLLPKGKGIGNEISYWGN